MPLLFTLLLTCPKFGSVVVIDVVNASDAEWEQLTQAQFQLTDTLSRPPRVDPSSFVLHRRSAAWKDASDGVIVLFLPWLPDDDIGLEIGPGRVSTLLILDRLKGAQLRDVFIHEVGHALGLDHSTNPKDIMWHEGLADNINKESLLAFRRALIACSTE